MFFIALFLSVLFFVKKPHKQVLNQIMEGCQSKEILIEQVYKDFKWQIAQNLREKVYKTNKKIKTNI